MGEPTAPARPFLRWAGSKRQLLGELDAYWHASGAQRYVEPFVGSGALFFHVCPPKSLLSDLNPCVTNALARVRDDPAGIAASLDQWSADGSDYYAVRALDDSALSPVGSAARLIYLMRFAYGGIYRVNRRGQFNVPSGGARTGSLPTLKELEAASIALQSAQIETGDFESLLDAHCGEGDFVYLDPPYALPGSRAGLQYGYELFEYLDADRLAKVLKTLDQSGCVFVLSYADVPIVRERFSEWRMASQTVRRLVSSKRPFVSELLVTNLAADS